MSFIIGFFVVFFVVTFVAVSVIVPVIIFMTARRVFRFQSKVFTSIEPTLYQEIDQAEKPNKHYIKTHCDNCGAKCTNASDISPSGDLKCEYCNTWFNVLRPR